MNLDFLATMKKSFAALRASQQTLGERIAEKKDEIHRLRTDPASRADVLADPLDTADQGVRDPQTE